MKRKVTLLLLLFCMLTLHAQEVYKTVKDLPYIAKSETDAYRKERCKLDVYYPMDKKDFPTIVWFHGGGLEGGGKHIPQELMNRGFAVVVVNYRLSPKAKNPAYIEDAAAAVAWTFNHIEEYGGSKDKIFVSGHSAGGYLALILAMDKKYMEAYGADAVTIFNRFYEPDIDIERIAVGAASVFSMPADLRTTLRWTGILSGKDKLLQLSSSTGVHNGEAVVKLLLAGATTVQVCSAMYEQGIGTIRTMNHFLNSWMDKKGFESIDEFRGRLSYADAGNAARYERAQFMKYFSDHK